jgi:hypothetical protein
MIATVITGFTFQPYSPMKKHSDKSADGTEYNGAVAITSREEQLVSEFRKLSANAAEQISLLIRRLASLPKDAKINWSDEWSDEDLQDLTTASLRYFESRETD